MMVMGKSVFKVVVGVVITFVLAFFLLRQVSVDDFLSIWGLLSFPWILVAFALYFFGYVFRALRFKFLLKDRVGLVSIFDVVCVHNLFNQLLPFRLGEFSFVHYLKRTGVGTTQSLSVLFVARVFDFVSIALIFSVSLLFFEVSRLFYSVLFFVGAVLVLLVLFFFVLVFLGRRGIFWLQSLVRNKSGFFVLLVTKLGDSLQYIFRAGSFRVVSVSVVLSLAIWVSNYLMYQALFIGTNISVSFWVVVAGVSLTFFVVMLPIHGFAGFGTIETAWAASFFLLGLTNVEAIATAFSFHVIVVAFFVLLGVFGLLRIRFFSRG